MTKTPVNYEDFTDKQLDEIYYNTIGYRPIADDGVTRFDVIDILSGWEEETGEEVVIPEDIEKYK